MLAGDLVPHFDVRTIDDEPFSYSSIWQRKNLLFVALPTVESDSAADYAAGLTARLHELGDRDVEVVITRERVPGLPAPGVVVADRWGEIVYAIEGSDVRELPSPEEVVEWLTFVRNRCPECEGETR